SEGGRQGGCYSSSRAELRPPELRRAEGLPSRGDAGFLCARRVLPLMTAGNWRGIPPHPARLKPPISILHCVTSLRRLSLQREGKVKPERYGTRDPSQSRRCGSTSRRGFPRW